ncbi:hypothetical protein BaRGS_00024410, partial [Batillaria attramentaria]
MSVSTRLHSSTPCVAEVREDRTVAASREKSPLKLQVTCAPSLPFSTTNSNGDHKPTSPGNSFLRSPTKRLLNSIPFLSPTPESAEPTNDGGKEGEVTVKREKSPSRLQATLPFRGLNVSPGMSMRRKILPHKRKLTRGMTCDTILFRPPPDIPP